MKRRLVVPLIFTGVALASGVASANPQYWRDNGLLLEVSADPRDGTDFVQVDSTRATRLELIALNDTVALRGLTVRFADGQAMTTRTGFVRPGQPIVVDLPRNCAPITGVELDYGDPAQRRYDRTTARLQIVPRMTRQFEQPRVGYYQPPTYGQPTYGQPTYRQPTYRQPTYRQPTYTYPSSSYHVQTPARATRYRIERPRRTQSTWQIQGSFRL